ncbi:hypothetical protein PspLS_07577 [Pyricularia sp. CBS 133598]|nr:hypothetical protein PspLS_07577 [Pyricularia sp. CBS 133598]
MSSVSSSSTALKPQLLAPNFRRSLASPIVSSSTTSLPILNRPTSSDPIAIRVLWQSATSRWGDDVGRVDDARDARLGHQAQSETNANLVLGVILARRRLADLNLARQRIQHPPGGVYHPLVVGSRDAGRVGDATNPPYPAGGPVHVQRLGQADLAGEAKLDDAAAPPVAVASARPLADQDVDAGGRDAEQAVEREDGQTERVDRHVAQLRRGGDDARTGEADVDVSLGEGRQHRDRDEVVGDAAAVRLGQGEFDRVPVDGGARARDAARDEARVVRHGGTRVRDLDGAAVGDGLEEAEERYLVRRETGRRRRRAADARDVDRLAGERRQDESLREVPVAGEPDVARCGGCTCHVLVRFVVCNE